MEIYDTLKTIPLFKSLDRHALWRIADLAQIKEFKSGEFLIHEGEKGQGCFIVTAGTVEVLKRIDNNDHKIATLTAGEIIGEISIIDAEPTTASVKAENDVQCIFIGEWDFRAQMQAYPEIALQLLPVLAKRLRSLYEKAGTIK